MKYLFSLVFVALASVANAGELTVIGDGSVSLPADRAVLSVAAVSESATAGDALKSNNNTTNKVFTTLKKLGVKKEEVQSQGVTVAPKYVYQQDKEPLLVGYTASHTINIVVCDYLSIYS